MTSVVSCAEWTRMRRFVNALPAVNVCCGTVGIQPRQSVVSVVACVGPPPWTRAVCGSGKNPVLKEIGCVAAIAGGGATGAVGVGGGAGMAGVVTVGGGGASSSSPPPHARIKPSTAQAAAIRSIVFVFVRIGH